jgi:hypothetical protein
LLCVIYSLIMLTQKIEKTLTYVEVHLCRSLLLAEQC